MKSATDEIARQIYDLQKGMTALSRGTQLTRSTIDGSDGATIAVSEIAIDAGDAVEAIPGLAGDLETNAETVAAGGLAADSAAAEAEEARAAGLQAAQEAADAAIEADFKAVAATSAAAVADGKAAEAKGQAAAAEGKAAEAVGKAAQATADAATAAGAAATADGKAVTAQNTATTASQKATDAAGAAGVADQKAVDAASAASAANAAALAAAKIADAKGEVIRQATAPSGSRASAANLWIRTSDSKVFTYDATAAKWVAVTDPAIIEAANAAAAAQAKADTAAAAATTAQATADGKNQIYRSTSAPTASTPGTTAGDIWWQRNATGLLIGQWEWSGTAWASRMLDTAVIANIDAGIINAGFISGDRIAAGSLTSRMIAIGDFENLTDDGTFESQASRDAFPRTGAWSYANSAAGAHSGTWYTVLSASTTNFSTTSLGTEFAVSPGDVIYMEWWQRRYNADRPATLNLQVLDYTKSSAGTVAYDLRPTTPPITAPNDVWVKYSGQVTIPAGGAWVRPQFKVNTNQALTGSWAFDDVVIRRASKGELIVDGGITAAKLAADSVTAAKIVAGTITSAEIAAGTIKAANIEAGAITTGLLAANAVTAAKIAAGTITAAEIAAGTITGSKIAAGTIVAGNIAAGTITTGLLAASVITAEKLATDAVTANSIKAGVITAAHVAAATLTAAEIKAASITGDRLVVNAITAREIAADAVTATQIKAGSIDGMIITGATIRTATTGARLEFTGSSLTGYASNNSVFAQLDTTGGGLIRMANQSMGTVTVKGVTWYGGGVVFTHPTYGDSTASAPVALAAAGIGWSKGSTGTVPALVYGSPTIPTGSAAGSAGFIGTAITASGAVIVTSYSTGMSPQITLDDARMTLLGGGENANAVPRFYVGQLGNPRALYMTAGDNAGDGTIGATLGVAGQVSITSGYLASQGTQYQSTVDIAQNIILRAARVGGLGNKAEIQLNGSDAVIITAPTASSASRTDFSVRSGEARLRFGNLVVEGGFRAVDAYGLAITGGRNAVLRSDGGLGYTSSKRENKKYAADFVMDDERIAAAMALPMRTYLMKRFIDPRANPQRELGAFAEDVHDAGFTELVDYGADEHGEVTTTPEALRYDRFGPFTWAWNQSQERRIVEQAERLAELERRDVARAEREADMVAEFDRIVARLTDLESAQ
jgi:chemotaxis protein histidine kinase CheA